MQTQLDVGGTDAPQSTVRAMPALNDRSAPIACLVGTHYLSRVLAVAVAFATLAMLLLVLFREPLGLPHCKIDRRLSPFAASGEVRMTITGNAECQLSVRIFGTRINDLIIERNPSYGKLTAVGKWGLFYRFDSGYASRDQFVIALMGESAFYKGRSLVKVEVVRAGHPSF